MQPLNKVLIYKQISSFSNKEDSLWIKWSHERYIKRGSIWDCLAKTKDSWHRKKVMCVKEQFMPGVQNGVRLEGINGFYHWLLCNMNTFTSAKAVWNIQNIPKNSLILWLVSHGKLLSRDRLCSWNMVVLDTSCLLCNCGNEFVAHLYFQLSDP